MSAEIYAEVERALKKFPKWPTDPIHAAAVVAEESGELVKAALESTYEPWKGSKENLRAEAVQTAAMCIRFIRSLDQYEFYHDKLHVQRVSCAACDRGDYQIGHAIGCPNADQQPTEPIISEEG